MAADAQLDFATRGGLRRLLHQQDQHLTQTDRVASNGFGTWPASLKVDIELGS
jgi:hypothetical protein